MYDLVYIGYCSWNSVNSQCDLLILYLVELMSLMYAYMSLHYIARGLVDGK